MDAEAGLSGTMPDVTRCLTQHQIDAGLLVVLAGACLVLVGAVMWVMSWSPPRTQPSGAEPADRRLRLLAFLPPAVGYLVFVISSGRVWEAPATLAAVAPAVALVAAAGTVERHRALAYASQTDTPAGWRRGHLAVKYGSPVLTVCGFLLAAGTLAWLIPADLCR